jgi:glycosyltransferase involved in cell wall biosynthesis
MENRYRPAIVIAAYNRPRSLSRLLRSLLSAQFKDDTTLIISIDNDEPNNLNVKSIAEDYQWPFGTKEVRYQEEHLGLRKHILQCGNISLEFGSVIILEDDLYVSPYFYNYATQALDYYHQDERINGISLYNQPIQEIVRYPFSAIYDNSDVYFIQFPSSLGQAWSREHWEAFMNWYESGPDLSRIRIPEYIKRWPESSWKKYFCAFLADKERYFVFPQYSLTTNFNDPGTNRKEIVNHDGQTPLRLTGPPYRFKSIGDSSNIYDANLEILPDCIRRLGPRLEEYPFEMDLYGTKDLDKVTTPYLITSRASSSPIQGYKRALKPHEMNIILNLEGSDFVLTHVSDILPVSNKYERRILNYKYFYTRDIIGWKAQVFNYYNRLKQKVIPKN